MWFGSDHIVSLDYNLCLSVCSFRSTWVLSLIPLIPSSLAFDLGSVSRWCWFCVFVLLCVVWIYLKWLVVAVVSLSGLVDAIA